jgi:holliday junction DNA helicase RuvA
LANAIALGDAGSVEQANGVGKKLAQRIVAELKDKAPKLSVEGGASIGGTAGVFASPPVGNAAAEAISALSNLGYQPMQAHGAVAVAVKELGDAADVAKLIRRGLKELAR